MKFQIVPDGDGFAVVMLDSHGNEAVRVGGFATHGSAQSFMKDAKDMLRKLLRSMEAQ